MTCRKIIKGIKNDEIHEYEIHELKRILDTYVYNKYDNNYNGKPVYKITDIEVLPPNEKYKKYPKDLNISCLSRKYLENTTDIIEVSNLGRIKINNKIQEQKEINCGYLFIDTIVNKPYVYRLVAETWCPCPKETNDTWQVHHITNNGYDNRPNNLIWVNADEHKFIDPYPNPIKRIVELKNNLFKKFDEIIYDNSTESVIDIFRDIVLIGNKSDKKRIEQYLTKIDIDIEDMKHILLNNIGIKI